MFKHLLTIFIFSWVNNPFWSLAHLGWETIIFVSYWFLEALFLYIIGINIWSYPYCRFSAILSHMSSFLILFTVFKNTDYWKGHVLIKQKMGVGRGEKNVYLICPLFLTTWNYVLIFILKGYEFKLVSPWQKKL